MRARSVLLLALLAVAAAGLIAHMGVFHYFVTDDAYISFVYARNFAEHGQLVFNLGEKPVEGYTNFLWTVWLAGWLKLGWKPESASVVWGAVFAIGTMFVCAGWSRSLRGDERWSAWDALPALLLAAMPGYACWSAGGLETQLFVFLVTLASALYLQPRRAPAGTNAGVATGGGAIGGGATAGVATAGGATASLATSSLVPDAAIDPLAGLVFGLSALARPEGALFFALALLHRSIGALRAGRRRPTVGELKFVALFLLPFLPHLIWRRAYYGWWLPNTFYIKSSGGLSRDVWRRGGHYLVRVMQDFLLPGFAVLAAASLAVRREQRTTRFFGYALLLSVAFFGYVASVAGDFMGLYRFALPAVPLVVLAGAQGLRLLLAPVTGASPWVAPAVATALLAGYVAHAVPVDRRALAIDSDNGIDTPGYLRYYTEDRAAIGRWFGQYAHPDDYAAVGGAGAQVYFSRIESLDCYGLSNEHIAHDVRAGDTRPGHQKYAPVEYQLARHPTIITSNYYAIDDAPRPRPDAPVWHQRGYRYVSAQVPGLSRPWYTFLLRSDRALGPIGKGENLD